MYVQYSYNLLAVVYFKAMITMSIKQHEILTDNIDSEAELSTAAGIAGLQLISTCVLSVTVYNG